MTQVTTTWNWKPFGNAYVARHAHIELFVFSIGVGMWRWHVWNAQEKVDIKYSPIDTLYSTPGRAQQAAEKWVAGD